MKKIYFSFLLIISYGGLSAQTTINFSYDESGNQILRNNCVICSLAPTWTTDSTLQPIEESVSSEQATLADFVSNQIQTFPVPVKTTLDITWAREVKRYITKIDLIPYNGFNIISSINVSSLNENSYTINMSAFSYGVYYLKFYLLDGSIYTRTITKE